MVNEFSLLTVNNKYVFANFTFLLVLFFLAFGIIYLLRKKMTQKAKRNRSSRKMKLANTYLLLTVSRENSLTIMPSCFFYLVLIHGSQFPARNLDIKMATGHDFQDFRPTHFCFPGSQDRLRPPRGGLIQG